MKILNIDNIEYINSSILKNIIEELKKAYPFLKSHYIGYSTLGKPIYCLSFGNGPKEFFYSGAIHRKRMDYFSCSFKIFR